MMSVAALLVVIAAVACVVIEALRLRASDSRRAQTTIAHLEALVNRYDAIQWEAVAQLGFNTKLEEEQRQARAAVDRFLRELASFPNSHDLILRIQHAIRAYIEALGELSRLIFDERFSDADLYQREHVRPAYNSLHQTFVSARADYADAAVRGEQLAAAGTALTVMLTVGGIAFLLRRAHRSRTQLRETVAEQRAVAQSEQRLRSLVLNATDIILVLNDECRVTYHSPSADGLSAGGGLALLGAELIEIVHPDDHRLLVQSLEQARAAGGQPLAFEVRLHRETGDWLDISATCRYLAGDDVVKGYVINGHDITERKQQEEQLAHLASRDGLTGLYNLRRFREEVQRDLARSRRYESGGAVLYIDLDGFKAVNDGLGHRTGDRVLTSVASTLVGRARETDIIARLGGDEFAVLMPRIEAADAVARARELGLAIHRLSIPVGEDAVRVTASIGVACFPDHGESVDDLLAAADMAMYLAKETRDDVKLYQPERNLHTEMTAQRVWEQRIRDALDQDRFVLHAQPIRRLEDSGLSYELLIRMRDEQGGLVPPMEFLPVAERTGLIRLIDRWVVQQAITLIGAHGRAGTPLTFSVNLSGRAFSDPDLLPLIERELALQRAAPERLILEITETAAIADMTQALQFVSTLRRLGCRFALDDFGVGFSSFYYLKHLPVDHVKIDGSFIRNLARDADDQHFVRAMVAVAHGLGKQTVAEFVGDEATVQLLRRIGVDHVQGFYIGRPLPLDEALSDGAMAVHLLDGAA